MTNKADIHERIEQYLLGMLDESESRSFEKMLKDDLVLKEQVDLHRKLHILIRNGALLDIKHEVKRIHIRKTGTARNIRRMTGLGGAGIIIALVAVLTVRHGQLAPGTGPPDTVTISAAPDITVPGNTYTVPATSDEAAAEQAGNAAGGQDSRKDRFVAPLPAPGNDAYRQSPSPEAAVPASEPSSEIPLSPQDKPTVPEVLFREITQAEAVSSAMQEERLPEPSPDDSLDTYPAAEIPPEKSSDCSRVNISGTFTAQASCNTGPTGTISVDNASLSGGISPYTFSIDGENFLNTNIFSELHPGSYMVYARDANQCIDLLGTAFVGNEDCTYKAVFAPFRGELWEVPVGRDEQGILTIYNASGGVVYSARVDGSESPSWNGTNMSGQPLPMGLYPFGISNGEGTAFTGTVTIVR